MYCPKCGQQQVSEDARFCSRCGVLLDVVRACLADEEWVSVVPTSPPHRDINSGVVLMLGAALFTSGAVATIGGIKPPGAFLLLTLAFISILLASRHLTLAIHRLLSRDGPHTGDTSAGRRGMGFGALLMYLGTILSACTATLVPGRQGATVFFFTLLTVFVLLLLSSRSLMDVVQELLTQEGPHPGILPRPRVSPASFPGFGSDTGPALGMRATLFGEHHVRTAEIAAPPSITERTTSLLAGEKAAGD